MNFRKLSTFLGSALLLGVLMTTSGCIIAGGGGHNGGGAGGGGGGTAANVTFQWTFGSETCGQHPEIATVQITIPGQSIMNNGAFPCTTNGFSGIVLHDFVNGSYNFTMAARDSAGNTLYNGSSSFNVNGQDITVTVDLVQVADTSNSATLAWTFPALTGIPNPLCTDVQITQVSYSIDNGQAVTVNCANGSGNSVQQTGHLSPGTHSIAVTAYDANTCGLYGATGTFQTFAGNEVPVILNLSYAVGGAVVKWQLEDQTGSQFLTCNQAQLNNVTVNFSLDGNTWVYPQGDTEACSTNGTQEAIYYCLPPGNYIVTVQGAGGGLNYSSNLNTPPGLTVTAGSFPDGTGPAGPETANVIVKAQ
ncbi:MAG: hypothetical protein QM723_36475 [Myxococcaceae bacterium]